MIDLFARGMLENRFVDVVRGYCWKRWSIFRHLCGKDGARVKGDSSE